MPATSMRFVNRSGSDCHIFVPGPRKYALTIMPAITWIACRPVIVKYSPRKLLVAG